MQILSLGYCPFRVEVSSFKAGCALRMGNESTCYNQEVKPLIQRKETKKYFCPIFKFNLSKKIYIAIESLIEPLLTIQDSENTGYNVWPMLKGISDMKHKASTQEGKEIAKICQEVRTKLEEIVLEFE